MATRSQTERRASLAESLATARATSESARQAFLEARAEGRPSGDTRPLRLAWDRARAQVSSIEQLLLAYTPAHAAGVDAHTEHGETRAGTVGGA